MKFNLVILLIIILFALDMSAQQEFRQFHTNDSTTYVLNSDTSIVVSKTRLYYHSNGALTLFYDFSVADTAMYIRDFDIITDAFWYVIFAEKDGGGPSALYKSTNRGLNWLPDSSIYAATEEPYNSGLIADQSLYQLQPISADTILMFVSYYLSGIFYSIDAGQSWNLWFANTIANYKGLFECGTDYFLWGLEGDGFPGSMFGFSADLLLSPDTNNAWRHYTGSYIYHPDCYNAINPDCIFAPRSISGYDQFLFFQNYIHENRSDSSVAVNLTSALDKIKIYPNPSNQGRFRIEWDHNTSPPFSYNLYTATGQLIYSDEIQNTNHVAFDLSTYNIGPGLYILVVHHSEKYISKKIIY